MTVDFKNITRNSDVSSKYDELITYLKSRYKKFQQWPE